MTQPSSGQRIWFFAGLGLVVAIWFVFFAPVLLGTHQFGYRDSASLYQPMFEWTAEQWLSGQVPLWCPLDSWGVPVVGDATSSVFYPGKLIFLVSLVPFPVRFGAYVAVHVLLSVATAVWCARVMDCSRAGQLLAGIGYGLGGSILFQTCNVVFLVGAAWLPLALGMIWRYVESCETKWLVRLAVVMSLMVLGGDAQMAYHVALIFSGAVLWLTIVRRGESDRWKLSRAAAVIGGVAAISLALSAIQVLPAANWAGRSERFIHSRPRAIFDSIAQVPDNGWQSVGQVGKVLMQRPPVGTHGDAVYQFSLPPWTIADLLWPNVLGKLDFVNDGRWSNQLPGADRIWTGSIYLGLAVFLLAITHMICRGRQPVDKLLIAIAAFFLLGSFGWYGPGWLIHELQLMRGGAGTGHLIGEPTGGVYWLMEILLPWFSSFRYPAKLFVVAALAVSLLGGRGLDRLLGEQATLVGDRRYTRRFLWVASLCWLMTGTLWLCIRLILVPGSGLIDGSTANEIGAAFGHSAIVIALILLLVVLNLKTTLIRSKLAGWIIAITAIEIAVAVSWTVALIPWPDEKPQAWIPNGISIFRPSIADRYEPPPADLSERHLLDVDSIRPKHHLTSGVRQVNSFHSLEPLDLLVFRQLLASQSTENRRNILRALAVDTIISKPVGSRIDDYLNLSRANRFQFAYGELDVSSVDESDYSDVWQATSRVQEMLAQNPRSWFHVDGDSGLLAAVDTSRTSDFESVAVASESLATIQLRIVTDVSRLLVAADYFDKDWRAFVTQSDGIRREVPILRVNRILRGIVVPTGASEVEMVYRPRSFYAGAWISCVAWLALILWMIRPRRFR